MLGDPHRDSDERLQVRVDSDSRWRGNLQWGEPASALTWHARQ